MYQLRYREELPQPVVRELDDFIAFLQHYLGVSLNEDGTMKATAVTEATDTPHAGTGGTTTVPPAALGDSGEEHWWKSGPWTFDDPNASNPHVAEIIPVFSSGAISINDWAPQGIDNAVIITISQNSGNLIITGMKAPVGGRRRLVLISNTSAYTVTLKNTSASSQPINRFFTGANVSSTTDIVIAPGQNIWLFHNGGGWTNAITPQQSGGTFGEGSGAFPDSANVPIRVRKVFTNAEILTMNSVPLTLVAAPGATKWVRPISCFTLRDNAAGAWSANVNWQILWHGLTDAISTAWGANGTSVQRRFQQVAFPGLGNTSDPRNLALDIKATADVTGGNAANYLVVDLIYDIVTDGP